MLHHYLLRVNSVEECLFHTQIVGGSTPSLSIQYFNIHRCVNILEVDILKKLKMIKTKLIFVTIQILTIVGMMMTFMTMTFGMTHTTVVVVPVVVVLVMMIGTRMRFNSLSLSFSFSETYIEVQLSLVERSLDKRRVRGSNPLTSIAQSLIS